MVIMMVMMMMMMVVAMMMICGNLCTRSVLSYFHISFSLHMIKTVVSNCSSAAIAKINFDSEALSGVML